MASKQDQNRPKHTARPGPEDVHPSVARVLQKRQFISAVAQRTGLRSVQVKEIVDATLAELGDAIAAGQTLALPPLGRARINRQRDVSGAEVITLRLRRRVDDTQEQD
ncbi:MAG: HU family DNA-binding protein [Paracoccus sp. (in: a-proteobacteria)]|uniref:HU family DNA-binding protein n=1 Tax=Paracoccus sp. TaxID=267 RepID=UPI0039E5060D